MKVRLGLCPMGRIRSGLNDLPKHVRMLKALLLWFQVGAIDFSLARNERRPTGLPVLNRISRCWFLVILLLSVVSGRLNFGALCVGSIRRVAKGKPPAKAAPSSSSGEQSLTNIPLPNWPRSQRACVAGFRPEGHLRGKFEAERRAE